MTGIFARIPKTDNLFEIELPRALELLAQPKKGRGRAAAIKELGVDPSTQEAVSVFNGKYGPYVKSGKVNASVPDDIDPADVTLSNT